MITTIVIVSFITLVAGIFLGVFFTSFGIAKLGQQGKLYIQYDKNGEKQEYGKLLWEPKKK